MRTLPHIQAVLDRLYPGVKLRYNYEQYVWVLTDRFTFEGGAPAPDVLAKPTAMLRGCVGDQAVNEGVVAVFQDPDTKERWEPHLDLVLGFLNIAFHGNQLESINQVVDDMETEEDFAEALPKQKEREAAREAAENAWRQAGSRRVITTGNGQYTDPRKVQRAIRKQAEEESRRDREIELAVMEQAAEGKVCLDYQSSPWGQRDGHA